MMDRLSKPVRQLLAVGLLVAAIGLVVQLLVVPFYGHVQGLRFQIEQERLVLGRLSSIRADETELEKLERMTRKARESGLFLDGESDPIRVANLQSRLSGVLTSNGARMRSTRNLPARERNDVRLLGVQLQFAATIEQLQRILIAVETQRPYLFVESLHITPMPGALAAGGEATGMLDARFEVLGATPRQKG